MSTRIRRQTDHTISSSHEGDIELGQNGQDGGLPAIRTQSTPNPISVPTPEPLRVTLKLLSAGFSFFVAGTNDGSIGALIPYMIESYHIGTSLIAVLYV